MYNSKNILLTLSLVVAFTFNAGCLRGTSKPASNSSTNKNVDFRVLEIHGRFIEDNISNIWTFPTQKTYEFRACLIGRATNAQLPEGQKFMVIQPDNSAIESETDDLGCFNWRETIDFNFASNSVYLKKSRRIKSMGSYKGEALVEVAINPWASYRSDPGNEVIDLSRTAIASNNIIEENDEELQRRGFFNNDDTSSRLLLDPNLDFNIVPVRDLEDGKALQLVVRLNPYIEPKNLRGSPERFDLRTGHFRVFAQLVSNYVGLQANQHALLTTDILPKDIVVTNSGILSISLNFELKRRIDMGQVQLALKIEPLSTPYPIQAYEGLHTIGNFDSILGGNSAVQILGHMSDQNFNYGEFIHAAVGFEDLQQTGIANNLPPIYYDYFDPRFVRIKSGETSTQRTLMYRVTTIVRDSISGRPVRFQPFKIKKLFTNTEVDVTSDENGRLIWNDELSHLYYKPEQYFFPEFEITQVVSGHKFNQTIAVNPWDFGWTFGVDTRGQEEYYRALSQRPVNPPQFMIDAFRYQTIRFRYVIDEFLTLNVKKAVVMALDPLVERNTINEGRKFEPLRNGIYLVKIALVKYYLDPFQNNTRLAKYDGSNISPDSQLRPTSCPEFDVAENDEDSVATSTDYPDAATDARNADNPEDAEPVSKYRLEAVGCNGEAKKGQYTTVIKKLLRVQAGRITTPLEFSMRDLRMMSIRSNIMVQLETIDENKLLRDNIIDAKLNELVEEYYAFQTEGMTEEEKEAFLAEKQAAHLAEAEKLREAMAGGLQQIQAEREALNTDYEARDRILSGLIDSLGNTAETSEIYKQNINLPEEEFLARINAARTQLNSLHSRIEDYWTGYEQNWVESQLTQQSENGLLAIPVEQLSKKPSYYDYLASMNAFLTDFGLGTSVGLDDLNALEINNYSDNPLTPLVDLNLYIENSGLKRRTFIGPCTLVENDNMSEMRPTDKIDEATTARIDNSQEVYVPLNPPADNREFEQSAYHDSLIPFSNKHVDDIIIDHIENEKNYEREMSVLSQVGRYVHGFNLEYVSLTDQPLKEFKTDCTFAAGEDCFQETTENVTPKNSFFEILNKEDNAQLLGRYFYVRPLHLNKQLNEVISRENTLEPLWDRAKRSFFGLLPSDEDMWISGGLSYANGGIGNKYHWTASEYLEKNSESNSLYANEQTIKNWLNNGAQNLNLLDALKICSALTQQITSEMRSQNLITDQGNFWSQPSKTPEEYLLEYCFSKIHYIDDETIDNEQLVLKAQNLSGNTSKNRVVLNGITFDRRYKIHKTGPYEHIAGKNTNLNVGVDFSVTGYSDSQTVGTLGLNGGALIGLPAAGAGAAIGAAASGPAAPIGAVAGAVIGAAVGTMSGLLIAQETANYANGVNMTRSTSVSMATYLVIQKAEMDIVLEKYEKCLSLQFSPDMINGIHFDKLQLSEGITSEDLNLRNVLSRGYFICEGEVSENPVKVRENYYYVTQHFTAGDMLDNVNLLNHVWLLSLRGERDFNAFIKTMVGKEISTDGEQIEEDRLYDYSLYRLSTVYGKVLPTFPGMYSIQDPLPIHLRSNNFPRGF